MFKFFVTFFRREQGINHIELALLLALIALVLIGAMTAMGDDLRERYFSINSEMTSYF